MIDDPDHALLQRFRHGDAAAFRDLVLRLQRPVYNAAFWILRNPEDARDVAQTVFLRVAERAEEFDGSHKVFSWVYRIAVNEALNLLRRHGREEPLDEDADFPDGDEADPQRRLEDDERNRLLRAAIMKLPVPDRTVITLRHFAELSYQDIAHVVGVDEKTVKSRLFEARQRLRTLLPELAR